MLLTFDHVTGTGKGFLLNDITFELPAGFILGIAGKNGAGITGGTVCASLKNRQKK